MNLKAGLRARRREKGGQVLDTPRIQKLVGVFIVLWLKT